MGVRRRGQHLAPYVTPRGVNKRIGNRSVLCVCLAHHDGGPNALPRKIQRNRLSLHRLFHDDVAMGQQMALIDHAGADQQSGVFVQRLACADV